MGTAASDGKISLEPVRDPWRRDHQAQAQIRPASLPELAKLTQAMPEQ